MTSNGRKILEERYDFLYDIYCPNIKDRHRCFYCGLPADTRDHVPALNCVEDIRAEYVNPDAEIKYQKVYACRECNSMAGDIRHLDIWERRDWLKEALRYKYRKDIEQHERYEEDIEDIGTK